MATSPSRTAGYSNLLAGAVARDGLICFLCGQIHTRSDTMQVDFRTPLDNGGALGIDNVIPVCKPCAKRRNQSAIGAYWRKRLIDAQREIAYIHQMAGDADILRAISATVTFGDRSTLQAVEPAAEPNGDAD